MSQWPIVPLRAAAGETGFVTDGDWIVSSNMDPSGDIRLIQLADIGKGEFLDRSNKRMNEQKFLELGCTELRESDVLISRMADPIGRACVLPVLDQRSITAVDVTIVRTDRRVADPDYVCFVCNSDRFLQAANNVATGTTRSRITRKNLENLQIPLPPLSEQRRMVDILNHANGIRRLRREAQEKARQVISALFVEMFGDPQTNPKGWPIVPLGELGNLDRGKSKHRPRNDPILFGGAYPFIQTGDVANAGGRIKTYSETYSEQGLAQSKLWPAGTLCVTIAANIGKTGILDFDACFPDSVVGFTPSDQVVYEYVQAVLNHFQARLEERAPQLAQKNINLKILRALEVPLPPLDLQQAFASRVTDIQAMIAQQERMAEASDELMASLVARAFDGEVASAA